jgi:hypothetical protein
MPKNYGDQMRKRLEAMDDDDAQKRESVRVLQRWEALDDALGGDGVRIPEFARKMGVAEKTIRRDLDIFQYSLGMEIGTSKDKRLYNIGRDWILVNNLRKHKNRPPSQSDPLFGTCVPRRHR